MDTESEHGFMARMFCSTKLRTIHYYNDAIETRMSAKVLVVSIVKKKVFFCVLLLLVLAVVVAFVSDSVSRIRECCTLCAPANLNGELV